MRYRVVAVFEAKSGEFAIRGLTLRRPDKLTVAERKELRAYAEQLYRDLQDIAKKNGTTVDTSVGQIIKELVEQKGPGQLRSDIERLSEVRVFFGGEEVKLHFRPNQTKFFGIVPSDVNPARIPDPKSPGQFVNIYDEVRDAGIQNFEVIGFGVTQKELRSAAAVLAKALGLKKN